MRSMQSWTRMGRGSIRSVSRDCFLERNWSSSMWLHFLREGFFFTGILYSVAISNQPTDLIPPSPLLTPTHPTVHDLLLAGFQLSEPHVRCLLERLQKRSLDVLRKKLNIRVKVSSCV